MALLTFDCCGLPRVNKGPCQNCAPLTVDTFWDALRTVACLNPLDKAKCIVQLRRDDVAKAIKILGY